jgi:hypothetical protein
VNSFDDGSDFVVREECGAKCPDDFEDLQMRRDGLYILKNAKEHFTEEEKHNAGMMSCRFDTIIDGESCTLDAFMGNQRRILNNTFFLRTKTRKRCRRIEYHNRH